jgi:hypothetical protein
MSHQGAVRFIQLRYKVLCDFSRLSIPSVSRMVRLTKQGTTPCFEPKTRRLIMFAKTQIVLAAFVVAAFATPSFAQSYQADAQYVV